MKPSLAMDQPSNPISGAATSVTRTARRLLERRLTRLREGRIQLIDGERDRVFGTATGDLQTCITVLRPRFYRRAAIGGALGIAAAYLDGDWECDDLTAFFRIVVRNLATTGRHDRGTARLALTLQRLWHRARANTRQGSRRNIADHYDLGNDLFRLFLDDSMTYSAGVFETPEATLEQAQHAKLDRICRKLGLGPEHRVLEIGTGWGSFALHAAQHYGCHVTTTTISAEQYAVAHERVASAGLEDRVTLLQQDYRDLEGQFDRVVSIEMIEAVGADHLGEFFRVCSDRLTDDGALLLQVITTGDGDYERYLRSVDFIQRYVFPGSHCPAPSALFAAIGHAGDLRPVHLEDLGADYARTLREWRERFHAAAADVCALGYPERFLRLWDYYLQYCEAGFAERHIGDLQLMLAKPRHSAPPVRPDLEHTA